MPDLSDFTPLVTENVASIRARVDADVNAGLGPNDPDYVDTVEGGMFFDLTQVMILEIGRLYDVIATEAVAATYPAFAWGDYLDLHGELVGLERKDAALATGLVTFDAGAPVVGTAITIPTGTLVGTSQPTADADAIVFRVTTGGTIAVGQTITTLAVTAEEPGVEGNVATNAVDDLLSPVVGIASVYNSAGMSGGADVESDEVYRERILLEWRGAGGAGTSADYRRWALSYAGVGFATVEPVAFGAGTVSVVVTDADNRPFSGSVEIDAIQALIDPSSAATITTGSHTLPVTPINVVSAAAFDATGKVVIRTATGPQVVTYTGKTGTTLTGASGGTGTVAAGSAVFQGGKGEGLAPIGAIVAVSTPTTKNITVTATVTPETGYSLDGTSGTIAVRADLEAALRDYIDRLPPGGDVIYNHVLARFFAVTGVRDVASLTLNAGTANVSVASGEVAFASSLSGIV